MSILAKRSIDKEEAPGNVLLIAKEAQLKKSEDSSVFDATIGMFYDENNSFFTFKTVSKALNALSNQDIFAYSTTSGTEEYSSAIIKWVFGKYKDEILERLSCKVIATPGGTGAISNMFANYLDVADKVLLPSYMWENYKQFARENDARYDTYNLFNGLGELDFADLEEKAYLHQDSQGRVFLVINDPCHNPTGYSLSLKEWKKVINLLNKLASIGTKVILLYDLAYIDYDLRGLNASRENIRLFEELHENVLVVLAFSGSKTLGLYGIRVGAQVIIGKNKENVNECYRKSIYSARAKWSMTSTLGMSLITHIFSELYDEFLEELDTVRKIMNERAIVFVFEAKKNDLEILPYKSGFFITIPCHNPEIIYKRLSQKGVYVIPLKDSLRVAISAINIKEATMLPSIIAEVIKEANL